MANPTVKHVPSTVVCGPRGHVVTRGYTEIGGVRIYDDQVVVGDRGQHVIDRGYIDVRPSEVVVREMRDEWDKN